MDKLEFEFLDACENGDLQEVNRFIINYLDICDIQFGFRFACDHGHIKIVNRLVELCKFDKVDFNDGLWRACCDGHLEVVNRLIELGADDLDCALFYSSTYECMHVVDKLVKLGAQFRNHNINKKNYENWIAVKKILKESMGPDLTELVICKI